MNSNRKRTNRGGFALIAVVTALVATALWIAFGPSQLTPSAGNPQTTVVQEDTLAYPPPLSLTSDDVRPTINVPASATLLPAVGIEPASVQVLETTQRELNARAPEYPRLGAMATDGKLLVGITLNNNSGPDPIGQIAVIDLESGQPLTMIDVDDMIYPQVSDPYVVWVTRNRLHVYDRTTQTVSPLDLKADVNDPTVSGTVVVWENILNGHSTGLVAYDLVTGEMWDVTGKPRDAFPKFPSLAGDWVVYESKTYSSDGMARALTSTLQATNIHSRETIDLGSLPVFEGVLPPLFDVDGPWVVWAAWGPPTLNFYNFETGERREAKPDCALNGIYGHPNGLLLSGQIVLFKDCYQLMGYRIQDQVFFSLPLGDWTPTHSMGGWALGGGRLIWATLDNDATGVWQSSEILTAPLVDSK